jgi:hypothetical protein
MGTPIRFRGKLVALTEFGIWQSKQETLYLQRESVFFIFVQIVGRKTRSLAIYWAFR